MNSDSHRTQFERGTIVPSHKNTLCVSRPLLPVSVSRFIRKFDSMRARLLPTLLLLLFGPCPLVTQESRIELHNLSSAILGTQKNFNIFLPDGYDQEDERYPVVYLFRGNEREWANPTEDGSRRGNIKTVADGLYGEGKIGKVILVMPGLSEPATDQDFAFVLNELIPYIDRSYRTLPSRWLRGMDGFSYGGLSVLEYISAIACTDM